MIDDTQQAEARIVEYMKQFRGPYGPKMILGACKKTGDGRMVFKADALRAALWSLIDRGILELGSDWKLRLSDNPRPLEEA